MNQPSAEATATTTFVVRCWREWSEGESRWRGRVEHVQSGKRAEFLGVAGLLGFLEDFGITPESQPGSRNEDWDAAEAPASASGR